MLIEGRKLWPKGDLLQGEGGCLPIKPESVDIAVFITSLEFMPDASLALTEAARVARKGIIRGLMNKNSPSSLRKKIQGVTQRNSCYAGAKFYSISDVKKLLKKALLRKYQIASWSTTVFSKVFGSAESSLLPFGSFLGVAVKFGDVYE